MTLPLLFSLDLTPPPFSDGLCDWSRGDGGPASPTYESGEIGRIARNDPDFDICLELRKVDPVQRLRYMGEVPLRRNARIEINVRLKALRGPLPDVRIAASAGGWGGTIVSDLPQSGRLRRIVGHGAVLEISAVIGRESGSGVDLVWDERALFAHVGLDLLGPNGGVVRIENIEVREMPGALRPLPGFEAVALH